jgi:hypothetical protein
MVRAAARKRHEPLRCQWDDLDRRRKRDFACLYSENQKYSARSVLMRGTLRDRHERGGWDAVAAILPQRALAARGRTAGCGREIAWSWRPEAGAKPVGDDDPADDGGYQPDTGEIAYKR